MYREERAAHSGHSNCESGKFTASNQAGMGNFLLHESSFKIIRALMKGSARGRIDTSKKNVIPPKVND